MGQRVSFFVIAGKTYDEIYEGYRLLTGDVPMLPKSAYGYIQCKQRYTSQDELLGVAKGYRDRHYPIDDLVVDWFHYTKMGEMDMDPAKWPDPVAMNKQLHAMNFHTMISVWPRFIPEDRYYATILKNDWLREACGWNADEWSTVLTVRERISIRRIQTQRSGIGESSKITM